MTVLLVALLLTTATDFEAPQRRHLGMTVTATTARGDVPMGARIEVETVLRFDPLPSESSALRFDSDDGAWQFVFVPADSSRPYYREPFDVGMPVAAAGEERIVTGWTRRAGYAVHLLSPAGEQIPPGRYQLFAVYSNSRPGEATASTPSGGDDPWWAGVIGADPIAITVREARPRAVAVQIPTVKIIAHDERVSWQWDGTGARTITVDVRPGYALGVQTTGRTLVSGEETDHGWRGTGGIEFSLSERHFLPPELSRRILDGQPLELIIAIEIFESSVQPRHLWQPQRGDYSVLWKGEVRGTYP
jgi:hypothetical protein